MQKKTLQMKRALRTALLVLLLSVVGIRKGYAYDFSAVCETGQTLYYNITNVANHYVELTCPDNNGWWGFIMPTGSIILPESVQYDGATYIVTSIGNYAFDNCSGLMGSLDIPNSVTSIKHDAFFWCTGITSLTIPNSVTYIEEFAFDGCTGLTSVTIPNSVTYIGSGGNAFENCSGLEQIVVEEGNPNYDSRNNCNAIIRTSSNELISGCKNTIIPNSVTSICGSAFSGCNGLTSIIIPNSVTSIGGSAFYACDNLSSIIIPNSVIFIGVNPFACCSELEQIVVETGNPVYDSRNNCNAIIQTNTNELISGCMNTIIPNSVTSIGKVAFQFCTGLTSIIIPNSVISIGENAFEWCTGLTSVIIPNSVTNIGKSTFWCCENLTSITIGSSVSSIGDNTFYYCSNLNNLTVLAEVPPLVGTNVFYSVNPSIPVTVPCGCIPVYESSEWHSYFANILEDCTTVSEKEENTVSIYPIPTNGCIRIETEGLRQISISNMLGQTLYNSNASGNAFEYDFSKHEAGIYLIRIEAASGVAVKKVSVTH